MPGLDGSFLLAYAGPGAGLELIPYFMGLVAWSGIAFAAVLCRPVVALIGFLKRSGKRPKGTPRDLGMTAGAADAPPHARTDESQT